MTALEQLQELASTCAPSVGMHDVPRESVGQHLGFLKDDDDDDDDDEPRDALDERLAGKFPFSLRYCFPPRFTMSDYQSMQDIYTTFRSRTPLQPLTMNPGTRTNLLPAAVHTIIEPPELDDIPLPLVAHA